MCLGSNSSQPFGIPPDHLLPAQHVTQDTETQNLGHVTNLFEAALLLSI